MKLILRIFKQFIVRPLYFASGMGARLRLPILTALAWYLLTVRTRTYGEANNKKRLLALPKSGGPEDLYASLDTLEGYDIEVWTLVRKAVGEVMDVFLPKSITTDYVYASSDPEIERAKEEYREFLEAIWRYYGRWKRISAVIGFSIFYSPERELAAATEELGTPFLILFKEGTKSVAEHKRDEHVYPRRIGSTGRAISVYNKEERDVIVGSGFARPEQVEVVGCPRIDALHAWRRAGSQGTEPKLVLFFSFSPMIGVGLPWVEEEWWGHILSPPVLKPFVWEELARTTHLALLELAKKRPDINIVVKVKVGDENEDFVDAVLPANLPKNMKVMKRGLGEKLIPRASVVVGFNSTAILSSIAAGKPVVMPKFAEASFPGAQYCMFDYGEAASVAHSPEELIWLIEQAVDNPQKPHSELSSGAKQALERYVGNPDGKAGERMAAFILRNLV
ncbi:MAG: hypothetical protein Q8P39_03420 [Candidatus Yanofskybacteria bacterium]|nr:hypothetical protein [Candidatus Yanofskybacteria bacterium]